MYNAELHVHSYFSDGKDSVKKIIEVAISKGIDILSITDHDTVQGSLEALDVVKEENIEIFIIPGVEITTDSGHLLAYGIKDNVDPGMSMRETCNVVKKLGGLTFLAHPFDFLRNGSVRISDFKVVDGVEVYNAKSPFNFLASYFARKYNKPGIAGSDAHYARDVGTSVTFLNDKKLEALLNATYTGKRISFKSRLAFLLSRLDR